jgi:hypothetical protein
LPQVSAKIGAVAAFPGVSGIPRRSTSSRVGEIEAGAFVLVLFGFLRRFAATHSADFFRPEGVSTAPFGGEKTLPIFAAGQTRRFRFGNDRHNFATRIGRFSPGQSVLGRH